MMDNDNLVCGDLTILKNIYEFVNGVGILPYIVENKKHVPNHQPVMIVVLKFIPVYRW